MVQPTRDQLFLLLECSAHVQGNEPRVQTHLVLLGAHEEVLSGRAPIKLHELVKLEDPPLAAQVPF